jgi:MFS family permease
VTRITGLAREYGAAVVRRDAWRLVAAAFFIDFAFVFVFLVCLQSLFRQPYYGGHYLPALALSAYAAGKLAFQALGGRLLDRCGWPRTGAIAVAAMLWSQVLLLSAVKASPVVLPCAFAYGAASAFVWPAIYAGTGSVVSAGERPLVTSALTIATGSGIVAALGLGLLLPTSIPFAAAIGLACAMLSPALPLFATAYPGVQRSNKQPRSRALDMARLLDRRRACAAVIVLVQSAAVAGLVAVFRAFGEQVLGLGFHAELTGLLLPGAALGAGIVIAGLAGRVVGPRAVLSPAFLVSGLSLLALGGTTEWPLALAAASIGGAGLGLALPTTTALVIDLAQGTRAGVIFGAIFTFEGLGQVAGPLLAGLPRDPATAVQISGCLLLAGALGAGLLLLDVRAADAGVALAGEIS